MFHRKKNWMKGVGIIAILAILFQTMPSVNNVSHPWELLLKYFLGVLVIVGLTAAIYYLVRQMKYSPLGMSAKKLAVIALLACFNLAALGYLYNVGDLKMVQAEANSNNYYVVSDNSIVYYSKVDHFTVLNDQQKVLYDSSSNTLSLQQALNSLQGQSLIVNADVSGVVHLLHTDSEALAGADVEFTIPTLNYAGKMTEVAPGQYQFQTKETVTLTPQDQLSLNDLLAFRINNLSATYNGTKQTQFTTINQIPAADLFTTSSTTGDQTAAKTYTLPIDVSLSGQLVKDNTPVANRHLSAQVALQNAGYQETVQLDTDQQGQFTYNRNENVQITVTGGTLQTLAQPVKIDTTQLTAASSVVDFWWGDDGGGGGNGGPTDSQTQKNLGSPNSDNPVSVGEPINVTTGNMYNIHTDLYVKESGLHLAFTRTYNSQGQKDSRIGYGWNDTFDSKIQVSSDGNTVTKVGGEGGQIAFSKNFTGGFTAEKGKQEYSLKQNADGTYTVHHKFGKEYHYDSNQRLSKITDPNGNALTLHYDGNNQLTSVTDPYGRSFAFTYNGDGKIASLSGPSGTVRYAYSGSDLTQVTDTDNQTTTFAYDGNHHITQISEPSGRVTSFTYDDQNRATSSSFNDGTNKTTLSYNSDAKQTTVTDSRGNQTVYDYQFVHDLGVITKITDPLGHTQTFEWDDDMNRIAATDANGQTTRLRYDAKGNVLRVTDALGNTTQIRYDRTWNQPTEITDPTGQKTDFQYDSKGNLIQQTDALGNAVKFSYDSNGRAIRLSNPQGNQTTFSYDANGNMAKVTDSLNHASVLEHDAAGNLLAMTDANGNKSTFKYDAKNRMIQSTDPLGETTQMAYSPANELVKQIDPLGRETDYGYDAVGRMTSMTDPLKQSKQFGYDSEWNITSYTDTSGHKVTMQYDALNRPQTALLQNGSRVAFTFDAVGNLLSETNPVGQKTSYTYDALNRLTAVTDALGHSTQYKYDVLGNLIQVTDANGHSSNYRYDALGRVTYVTDADQNATKYTYDSLGNVLTKQDANGQTTTYSYDALGRLITIQFADGNKTTFTYDAAGNRIAMGDQRGTTQDVYDPLGRLVKETQPDGLSFGLSYDAAGNLSQISDPLGHTTNYQYDQGNRLTSVTDPSQATSTFTYDAAGRMVKSVLPNKTYTNYQYDDQNNLSQLANYASDDHLLSSFTYGYDQLGNRTSVTDADGKSTNYAYDGLSQLVGVSYADGGSQSFSYDAVGNRVAMTSANGKDESRTVQYQYDAANRLLQDSDFSYQYDGNGNLVGKTALADEQDGNKSTKYSYNGADEMVQINAGDDAKAEYGYDGLGRRISKTVDGKTTRYLYLDNTQVLMELDQDGPAGKPDKGKAAAPAHIKQVRQNVFGPQGIIGQYKINPAGQITDDKAYFQYDGLGSVVGITNKEGHEIDRQSYDVFGKPLQPVKSQFGSYAYTGKPYDQESGLYYFGARYYDPNVGRFTSKDPISGFLSMPGTLNPYTYVLNNPANFIDPDGRFVKQLLIDIAITIAIAIAVEAIFALLPIVLDYLLADTAATIAEEELDIIATDTGELGTRPTWQQSELDVGEQYPDYEPQKSFKDGEEVPYGTKGSSRPDFYKEGNSLEVKNYNVSNESGADRLVNNVTEQVNKRATDLPAGTQQTVIIDVRGQNVATDTLRQIQQQIIDGSNVPVQVKFMR